MNSLALLPSMHKERRPVEGGPFEQVYKKGNGKDGSHQYRGDNNHRSKIHIFLETKTSISFNHNWRILKTNHKFI